MNTQPERDSLLRSESGQAAALVALLMFFVFLGFAALAIDGAMTYQVRRNMQNVADASALAACRVVSSNGSANAATLALIEAENTISNNMGSWAPFVGSDPGLNGTTNVGTGTGLVQGIEIAAHDVRVAVMRQVPTVLSQFLGRQSTYMNAQAHCDSRAGGGLLPIAIQRYDINTGIDYLANQDAVTNSVFYSATSNPQIWPGRYGSVPIPVPKDPWIASDSNPGPEVVLLGAQATTNNGVPSMRDLVLLDIRNVADQTSGGGPSGLEYYNGAASQADAAKYMSQAWIYQHGYPGPFPQVDSEIAILSGASTDFTSGAMNTAGYQPGDLVAAIVYDGNVLTVPDFTVSLTPNSSVDGIVSSQPVTNTPVIYNLHIQCATSCAWPLPLPFEVTFDFTNKLGIPAGLQLAVNGVVVSPDTIYSLPMNVPASGADFTVQVWDLDPVGTTTSYLSGLNVAARSTTTKLTHGTSSNFGFGTIGTNDYTLRSSQWLLEAGQSSNFGVNPVTYGIGIPNKGCKGVPISAEISHNGTQLTWGAYFSSPNYIAGGVTIPQNTNNKSNQLAFPLDVQPNATLSDPFDYNDYYVLKVTIGGSFCNGTLVPTHTEDIQLRIVQPQLSQKPDKYVRIQGYAVFKVTRYDPPNSGNPNTVFGEAVTQLFQNYSDITIGLQSRLVPWQ